MMAQQSQTHKYETYHNKVVGKVDISNMVTIEVELQICFWSPKLDWFSWKHITPLIAKQTKEVTDKTYNILDTQWYMACRE